MPLDFGGILFNIHWWFSLVPGGRLHTSLIWAVFMS